MQAFSYELFCIFWNSFKQFCGEVQGGGGDVAQSLLVGVPTEGREAGEEDVGQDAHRPDVCRQADRLVRQNLRGCKNQILQSSGLSMSQKLW